MIEAYICDAVRTPIGRFGGALSSIRTDDLATIPIAALLRRNPQVDPREVDDVFLGCANQAGEDNRNIARMAALLAGLPVSTPGVTINRLCASGADAVGTAARAVIAGQIDLAIAGGVESMTRAPYIMAKGDKAFSRTMQLEDTVVGWRLVNPRMQALYRTASMPAASDIVPPPNAMAAILADASQSRFARPMSERRGLPRDIWQFDQYSPVMPTTMGLAANRAGVAARCAGDLVKCRAMD